MKVAVIGGGAAGFFAAIAVKENYPDAKVVILEKTQQLLSKVKISGGGRCNVTSGCTSISELAAAYPRGGKALKKAFHHFNTKHAMQWFESRGVALITQEDNRVFPASQSSQSIVDCLLQQAKMLNVQIKLGRGIKAVKPIGDRLELEFEDAIAAQSFDKVIVATGGCPHKKGLRWLEELQHKIAAPVPSLFTFNLPKEAITELMGVVVEDALVGVQGAKVKAAGPLLITHWGMSGPAILQLSSFGARLLHAKGYEFNLQVNWTGQQDNQVVMDALNTIANKHRNKLLPNIRPYSLPERLWRYLLKKNDMPESKKWGELGKKGLNRLVNLLTNDIYSVQGKTTFKEEFVTCGGVSLESVDINTMQSRVCKNLYFAGELLDIDGITGGYNFQAAWTTAYIAAWLEQ